MNLRKLSLIAALLVFTITISILLNDAKRLSGLSERPLKPAKYPSDTESPLELDPHSPGKQQNDEVPVPSRSGIFLSFYPFV
jgi:hypothetical protein